tara:strand:+ start:45744 stop:46151 length:408 start_codon:yes stop_codon:yes gene_type:complete
MSEFKQIIPIEPVTLANAMITPDGTVIQSFSQHDCKRHVDENGLTYMVDGGLGWYQRAIDDGQGKRIIIDSDDDHSVIREWFSWGSYGKKGDQLKRWIKLKDMEDDHINSILDGNFVIETYRFVFENETEWRKVL